MDWDKYDLLVEVPLKCFEERSYILKLLLSDFLNFRITIRKTARIEHYLLRTKTGHLEIEDHFFRLYGDDYLNKENIPESTFEFFEENSKVNLIGIYGRQYYIEKDKTILCGLDLFASSYFMVTRWEEYVLKERDEHGRFNVYNSLAFQNGFLKRPVVNEYLEFLYILLIKVGGADVRQPRNFQFFNTHDIDRVHYISSLRDSILKMTKALLVEKSVLHFLSIVYFSILTIFKCDIFFNFEKLMSLSEKYDLKSRFYFMSSTKSHFNSGYNPQSTCIREVFKSIIERGHIIGFHPGYEASTNWDIFIDEKRRLETATESRLLEGRLHYLKFSTPNSWKFWEQAGLNRSFNLSYSKKAGFRAGICYGYRPFDFILKRELGIKEIPTTVMDVSLCARKAENLNPEDSLDLVINLMNETKKYNGDFVFLWHNGSFRHSLWRRYDFIYERALIHASQLI